MAIYRVQGPDGSIHRFEGPDDATPEQIEAAAAQQFGKREAPPQRPNQAAMNPEVEVGPFTIQGETDSGFNPAAAIIKAGDVMDSLNKGALQMQRGPADFIKQQLGGAPDPILQAVNQERRETRKPMADLAEVHPGSTFIGEAATYAVSPNKAAPLMAAMEHGTLGERAARGGFALAGNKIGEAIGKGFGRGLQPTRPGEISATQRAANEAADRLGVKLSAGEATGNRGMRWLEASTADLPFASGMATKRATGNSKAMNTAALRELGQQGDEVTQAALAAGRQQTSALYKQVLDPAKIELDTSFRSEVKAIASSKVMKELRDEETDSLIGKFRDMPQGKVAVSGEWFQQNKTALDDAIRSAYNNGQPGKARALEAFERALDRAAMRSLPKDDVTTYRQATRQWATLRALEAGKVVEGGNVMPGRLNSYLEGRYKGAFKEGKLDGALPDIASLGNVLRGMPQSGTTPRAVYSGLAGGAAFAEPITAGMMLAGPPAAQALSTSPLMRKYLESGLLNVTPEMERLLMLGGGKMGLLGGIAASNP